MHPTPPCIMQEAAENPRASFNNRAADAAGDDPSYLVARISGEGADGTRSGLTLLKPESFSHPR